METYLISDSDNLNSEIQHEQQTVTVNNANNYSAATENQCTVSNNPSITAMDVTTRDNTTESQTAVQEIALPNDVLPSLQQKRDRILRLQRTLNEQQSLLKEQQNAVESDILKALQKHTLVHKGRKVKTTKGRKSNRKVVKSQMNYSQVPPSGGCQINRSETHYSQVPSTVGLTEIHYDEVPSGSRSETHYSQVPSNSGCQTGRSETHYNQIPSTHWSETHLYEVSSNPDCQTLNTVNRFTKAPSIVYKNTAVNVSSVGSIIPKIGSLLNSFSIGNSSCSVGGEMQSEMLNIPTRCAHTEVVHRNEAPSHPQTSESVIDNIMPTSSNDYIIQTFPQHDTSVFTKAVSSSSLGHETEFYPQQDRNLVTVNVSSCPRSHQVRNIGTKRKASCIDESYREMQKTVITALVPEAVLSYRPIILQRNVKKKDELDCKFPGVVHHRMVTSSEDSVKTGNVVVCFNKPASQGSDTASHRPQVNINEPVITGIKNCTNLLLPVEGVRYITVTAPLQYGGCYDEQTKIQPCVKRVETMPLSKDTLRSVNRNNSSSLINNAQQVSSTATVRCSSQYNPYTNAAMSSQMVIPSPSISQNYRQNYKTQH